VETERRKPEILPRSRGFFPQVVREALIETYRKRQFVLVSSPILDKTPRSPSTWFIPPSGGSHGVWIDRVRVCTLVKFSFEIFWIFRRRCLRYVPMRRAITGDSIRPLGSISIFPRKNVPHFRARPCSKGIDIERANGSSSVVGVAADDRLRQRS